MVIMLFVIGECLNCVAGMVVFPPEMEHYSRPIVTRLVVHAPPGLTAMPVVLSVQ